VFSIAGGGNAVGVLLRRPLFIVATKNKTFLF